MIKGISWLDIKLGMRMLVKYPWLTIVGGLGMAVAVAIGASFFGVIYSAMKSTVPLPAGDRIVTIQNWSDSTRSTQRRILHDFFFWREKVTTIEDVGAFHPAWRNVVTPYGDPEPMAIAEMSASGFRTAGVAPLIGRHLNDSDEGQDAEPVAVIGEEIWRQRFAEHPDILQQSVQIGTRTYRIVGVMPKAFGWPLYHQVWLPLRMRPTDYRPRSGPILHAFGRLKPGVTLEQAQAEMTTIGQQMAAANPQTHAQLRPAVLPYTYPFVDIDSIKMSWAFHALQMSITLLLVLVCANVATLIYARTATRQGEIAVRTALGASRGRIVGQLFAEALVLAALASVAGVTMAKVALNQINIFLTESVGPELPFWMRPKISAGVIFYTVAVTVLAAAIVGAMPALKATGRRVQSQLRQLGGGSGLLLGRTWTILIIAQVAFAVTILPSTISYAFEFATYGVDGPGFAAENYLSAELFQEEQIPNTEDEDAYFRQRAREFSERQAELMSRLRAETAVGAATFAWRVPGEESTGFIDVEGLPLPKDSIRYSLGGGTRHGHPVRANRVDTAFFNTFGVSLLHGRGFNTADYDSVASAVIVNQTFVDRLLNGQNVLGRRFRYLGRGADADPINLPFGGWYKIVGVVSDFPPNEMDSPAGRPRVYHPPIPGRIYRHIFIRMPGGSEPSGFAGRLKRITTSVDPMLQLTEVRNLRDDLTEQERLMRLGAIALITLTVSVLLLSAAGIYSVMSLAINQRRREIGIRSALGAYPRNILTAVFKRAARQLAIGVAVGILAAFLLDRLTRGLLMEGHAPTLLLIVATIMTTVGLLAALGPARRGLSIQPTEALREL